MIGTCFWIISEFCCDRRQDLFYVFDWNTKTWSNQYIHTVYPDEYPGGAVTVSTKFLQADFDCVGIKWPNCIQNGILLVFPLRNTVFKICITR